MAALVVFALIVVMLIVPWFLAREPGDVGIPQAADSRGASPGTLFTSPRERRLWLWTMAVMVAIYSTLAPAAGLVAALRAHNLLRVSMAAVLLVVTGVLVVRWARTQPGRREGAVALGVAAVYVTALIRMPSPEERTHLFEYGLVALLLEQAFIERRRYGRGVPAPAALAVAATALLGWLDEGIQSLLPTRVYDLRDVGFNALAGLIAIASRWALNVSRSRWRRRHTGPGGLP